MYELNWDDVGEENLQYLIDNQILEQKTLEYKLILLGNSDGDKKEFLADVSSFANTNGGIIIYGIREDESHIPVELIGLDINSDDEQRRLESIIRDGIEPRIPNIAIKIIDLNNGNKSLLIRIPKSWLSPHMVTFKGTSKFYLRASNGKYQMDIGEIRTAFTHSDSQIQQIKNFVQNRISEIYSNNPQLQMDNYPKLVVHIVPISSFETSICENFNRLSEIVLLPMCSGGANRGYNADGLITYSRYQDDGLVRGYVQIFRNGVIEAVSSFLSEFDTERVLPITLIENVIIDAIKNYSKAYGILKIDPPIYIFINLISVKGLELPRSGRFGFFHRSIPIQKDLISLPNVEFNKVEFNSSTNIDELKKVLKLPFDTLANAVGLPGSTSYDESGQWNRS